MADDVTITVRADDQTARAFRDVNGRVRDMRGRFVSDGAVIQRSMSGLTSSVNGLAGSLRPLAAAAAPLAAAMAPLAAQAGAAGVAFAAFGAAIGPQVSAMSDAAAAQEKYTDAVTKYGPASTQAAAAQKALADTLKGMPAATRQAAGALMVLKDGFADWSDEMAQFTMVPVTRSFGVLQGILPKLSPMVRDTSGQLNRLVTAAGGAINTPGFDALAGKFTTFANDSVKGAVDGIIHLTRALSEGDANGPLTTFMEYARANGPALRELLGNVGDAVGNLAEAAADAGPGMLTLVNAAARLVAALPPELVTVLLQTAVALKAVTLAGAGVAAVSGGMAALRGRIVALGAASAAAGGGLAGLRAAFLALGTAAKASIIVAGVGLLVVALMKLSEMGKQAPPNVDRMTTSLGKLAQTGKASGEAARVLGADLSGLADALRTMARPSNLDKTQQSLTQLLGMDSTPVKEAKEKLDGLDKALANLVKGGNAPLAEEAFTRIAAAMKKKGMSSSELRKELGDYRSALADAAFEEQLAADAMGLFGQQALAVQEKLNAQKASADGLRQAITALNDAHRAGLGGVIGFEAAIDAASKAAAENAGALRMVDGQLDLNGEKARNAATALNDLAAKTDEAAAQARQSGESWSTVNGIYKRGRDELIKQAQAMGLTRDQAAALAAQILKTPDKTARLKGNLEDLESKLAKAKNSLKNVPDSRKAKVRAEIADLEAKIRRAKGELASLRDKTVTVTTFLQYKGKSIAAVSAGRMAEGGVVDGPGTDTSDSVPIMASRDEFIVNAKSSRKHRGLLEAINDGALPGFAKGGVVSKAERDARAGAAGAFGVSPYGRVAGYTGTSFGKELGASSSVNDLVNSLNKWRGIIRAATSGVTEKGLLTQLSKSGAQLLRYERQQAKVNAALDKARDKLSGLRDAAGQMRDQVAGGITGAANITQTAQGGGPVTTGGVLADLRRDRDRATALEGALEQLRGKGLNAESLAEIGQAGIEGGGLETASALLGASKSDIKEINALEKQLKASATESGKITAGAMYNSGIKAAEGLVKGLEKQRKNLERLMESIAKALEKSLKRAFGLGGKASGGIIGGAASGGARGGMTWVGEQGPEVVRLPYGSRVYPAGQSRQMAAAGGGRPIIVHQTITLDGKVLAHQLFDPLRGEISKRGGNVQQTMGR